MFAVLHIADFALEAVLRTEAGASARPAALFADTSKKSVVLAANARARAAGVELGMTAPQAVARCPTLVVRAPNAGAETEARATLLAAGFTLSPMIEDTAPGVCTVDVKGVDRAKLEPAVRNTVEELTRLGLPATAGLAATPLLALYAARTATAVDDTSLLVGTSLRDVRGRLGEASLPSASLPSASLPSASLPSVARPHVEPCLAEPAAPYTASPLSLSSFSTSPLAEETGNSSAERKRKEKEERERSTPLLHITDARAFLAPLPLAAADPTPELASILASWGLRTLGDLTALPRDEIVRRFGAEGLALWQRASGGSPRPLHPVAPPQTFSAAMELEDEIETLDRAAGAAGW